MERTAVAKAQGPEEFFEALRSAQRDSEADTPVAPAPGAETPAAEAPQPNPVATPRVSQATEQPRPATASVFAKDDPTITIRRSTLIFAAIVAVILLFIAFAIGKRAGAPAKTTSDAAAQDPKALNTRGPAVPDHLRGKSVICLKTFGRKQDAGPANARTFRTFLETSPDAAFVKSSGRQVFILEYENELQLCVGPFDGGVGTPTATGLLQELRQLRYNNVRQFDYADVRPVQDYAKVFN